MSQHLAKAQLSEIVGPYYQHKTEAISGGWPLARGQTDSSGWAGIWETLRDW